ncbi:MAG: hypothetical protein WCS65_05865 [Verrucomicrobiae bacterium]
MKLKRTILAVKLIILTAVAVLAVTVAFNVFVGQPPRPPSPPPRGVPVVFRTKGGLLEIGGFDFTEDFFRANSKTWWGIYLGTTVSQIQVPATYRYHIALLKDWTVHVKDNVCIVNAPSIAPSLPVAFDSSKMIKKTESGWARFDKDENLSSLEISITPELNKRADDPQHIGQVREHARQTVAEFIQGWLLKDGVAGWKNDSDHAVKVFFPGEPVDGVAPPQVRVENL